MLILSGERLDDARSLLCLLIDSLTEQPAADAAAPALRALVEAALALEALRGPGRPAGRHHLDGDGLAALRQAVAWEVAGLEGSLTDRHEPASSRRRAGDQRVRALRVLQTR